MNKVKLAIIAALLGASTFGVAYAKSYDVTLFAATVAGSVTLPPGTYRVEYTESTATLTNAANGKRYKVPVKITNAEKSFQTTSVDSVDSVKPAQLKSIQLGGSNVRLEFEK